MSLAELVSLRESGVERRFRRKEERSSSFRGPRPADPGLAEANQFRETHQLTRIVQLRTISSLPLTASVVPKR
jgi:hypothetical protein